MLRVAARSAAPEGRLLGSSNLTASQPPTAAVPTGGACDDLRKCCCFTFRSCPAAGVHPDRSSRSVSWHHWPAVVHAWFAAQSPISARHTAQHQISAFAVKLPPEHMSGSACPLCRTAAASGGAAAWRRRRRRRQRRCRPRDLRGAGCSHSWNTGAGSVRVAYVRW